MASSITDESVKMALLDFAEKLLIQAAQPEAAMTVVVVPTDPAGNTVAGDPSTPMADTAGPKKTEGT